MKAYRNGRQTITTFPAIDQASEEEAAKRLDYHDTVLSKLFSMYLQLSHDYSKGCQMTNIHTLKSRNADLSFSFPFFITLLMHKLTRLEVTGQ